MLGLATKGYLGDGSLLLATKGHLIWPWFEEAELPVVIPVEQPYEGLFIPRLDIRGDEPWIGDYQVAVRQAAGADHDISRSFDKHPTPTYRPTGQEKWLRDFKKSLGSL